MQRIFVPFTSCLNVVFARDVYDFIDLSGKHVAGRDRHGSSRAALDDPANWTLVTTVPAATDPKMCVQLSTSVLATQAAWL